VSFLLSFLFIAHANLLMLWHLTSNATRNVSIAASLKLPDTHFLLDYHRPDLLALRVVSRSLILWDEVAPTAEWIDLQIPSIVRNGINFMKRAAKKAMDVRGQSIDVQGDNEDNDITDFDPQAVRQANACIIAGACFSLGLRYAGSSNRLAASAIFERILWFLELRDNKDVVTLCQRPDTATLIT
jgi:anaphase-promoting complex subunit 1